MRILGHGDVNQEVIHFDHFGFKRSCGLFGHEMQVSCHEPASITGPITAEKAVSFCTRRIEC